MDANELRELADALERIVPHIEDILHSAPDDLERTAAYLRQCADAQPIGYATANGLRMLKQDDATVLLYKHDYLIRPDHVALYTHPAPAAPQAEPKREPTCLWRADEYTDMWETSCGNAYTIIEGMPSDNHMEFCCYCGRHVDEEIGGSDAE